MTARFQFDIDNMTCAGCAGRAERALAALPGIAEASVNFATRRASVTTEGAEPAALAAALREAGYPAREAETVLTVSGMTCAGCAGRVERALEALPGMIEAHVNFASGTAHLRHLAGALDLNDMIGAVTAEGYTAAPRDLDTPAVDEREAEIGQARWRMLLAAALTLPVFVLEMGSHLYPPFHHFIGATLGHGASWTIQFVLATLVLAGPGAEFFRRGIPALLRGAPDMNSLVALGTAAAYGFSTVALFAPSLLPEGTRAVYFEAAAVIVTLILLGRWLEARAKGRTGAAIRRLIGLRPATALREGASGVEEVPVETVQPGDVLQIRPGARVPVDGEVLSGDSYVDESMITGEPVPVAKTAGAGLVGGTVNGAGALRMTATRVGRDTVLAQIIAMVESAQGAKLPIQALADRVVRVFVPIVMAIAALAVALWLLLGADPALGFALVAGVSVLIIACPCAMGLATPTSIMVGTGRAAEMGVLFRKGDALQALGEAKVIAFDKTGTLTLGRPELTRLETAEGVDRKTILAMVAAAESSSEHPIARAIEAAARAEGLALPEADGITAIPGYGLSAGIGGRRLLVGAERLMRREGVELGALAAVAEDIARDGETPLFAALDGRIAAAIGVSDPLKPGARDVVAALKAAGLQVAMITGDARGTAEAIARRAGIDDVQAEVLPGGKQDAVARLRAAHGPVAFVGDGINDAPALAEADVGIAMGTGTDVAIESADVVLVSGALSGALTALHVSRRTMTNIRQNLFWAFAYNVALIPVAAGALYPVAGVLLSPMLAAGAMALSSVFVLTNALRLRRVGQPMPERPADPAGAPATA